MPGQRPEGIWDENYVEWIETAHTQGGIPGQAVYCRYMAEMRIARRHAVLDLGTGTGRLLAELLGRVRLACGIDLSMTMMTEARRLLGERALLVKADAQSLPFADASFDHIVGWGMWENIPHQRRALAEVARVLRPGGRLLLTSKNFTNLRNLRLVWWRIKGGLVRGFWRWARERPAIVRRVPERLRGRFERAMQRTDIPQYPTFWPPLLLAARRLRMEPILVHKYCGPALQEDDRAPESAWTHHHLIVVFEKRSA